MAVRENAADAAQREKLGRQRELSAKTKICDIVIAAAFCLFIGGFALLHIVTPDRDMSDRENRVLAKFPKFSAQTLFSGEFSADMTEYLSDQFPFRDFFVSVKAGMERLALRMENGGVMFTGDTLTARNDHPSADNLDVNLTSAAGFSAALEKNGIPTLLAAAGRRADVCIKDLPPLYGTGNQDALWNLIGDGAANFAGTFVNLRDPLRALADLGESVYYRTDHHWTSYGAYMAYLELWENLPASLTDGLSPLSMEEITAVTATGEFYGTAFSSAGASWITPDMIELYRYAGDEAIAVKNMDNGEEFSGMYRMEYLDVRDKYSVFLGMNAGRLDITGNSDGRGTIVLIKDSFAQSLAPFLARDFDIIMIDPRYFSDSIYRTALELEPDAVVILMNADTLTSSPVLRPLMRGVD